MFLYISVLPLEICSDICGSQFPLRHLSSVLLSLGKNYHLSRLLPPPQALACHREGKKNKQTKNPNKKNSRIELSSNTN